MPWFTQPQMRASRKDVTWGEPPSAAGADPGRADSWRLLTDLAVPSWTPGALLRKDLTSSPGLPQAPPCPSQVPFSLRGIPPSHHGHLVQVPILPVLGWTMTEANERQAANHFVYLIVWWLFRGVGSQPGISSKTGSPGSSPLPCPTHRPLPKRDSNCFPPRPLQAICHCP